MSKTYFQQIPVAVVKQRVLRRRAILTDTVKKPKRPKRKDAAQSAFRALRHVIETTEGKKPTPKRKTR